MKRVDDRKARIGPRSILLCAAALIATMSTLACRQKMAEQPRYDPLEPSVLWADGQSARPLVEGTVARGELRDNDQLFFGGTGNNLATQFPFPITMDVLRRGQERYNIFCSPCHDRTGSGNGMIVQRGFARPPSYHSDILRKQPVGHFFRVITQGFGAMPSYAAQISAADRWAIVAYIRALQLSQNAGLADVAADKRNQIGEPR